MKVLNFFTVFLLFILSFPFVFAEVDPYTLSQEVKKRAPLVPEFEFIIREANRMGVKVYLFGGTAAAFAHYVRWDMERENGVSRYLKQRFDYDFTNIYRGNQDLDVVIDGTPEQAAVFRDILASKYPHFMGDREAWEVRLLKKEVGDKQALLKNPEFLNQHSDTNSTGLLLLNPDSDDFILKDLRSWSSPSSDFLIDIAQGKIRYIYSDKHESTKRFKDRLNPPVLSAIRYLAKLTQYELEGTQEDFERVRKIIVETDFSKLSSYAVKKVGEFGLKVLLNSPNLEYASDILDKTGLRKKLIEMDRRNKNTQGSLAWWMGKEPLRSSPMSHRYGSKTAADLFKTDVNGDIIVAHETDNFIAYESIVKAADGDVNAFISRNNALWEAAAFGNGFYVKLGQEGARGTGLTIRMKLDSRAVEGKDFDYVESHNFLVVKNKSVLKVIPDDLSIGVDTFFDLLISGEIGHKDRGLFERLSRKYRRQGVTEEEMEKAEKRLEGIEWSLKNLEVFNFWFSSSFIRKKKELLKKAMHSELPVRSAFNFLYPPTGKKGSPEVQKLINEEFLNLELHKVFKELEELSSFSIVQKKNIIYLLVLFKVYKSVQGDSKLVSDLDKRVRFGFRRLMREYEKYGTSWLKLPNNTKDEIEKISKYLVDKVQESSHLDDDIGLLFVSKFLIRSYISRIGGYSKDALDMLVEGVNANIFYIPILYANAALFFKAEEPTAKYISLAAMVISETIILSKFWNVNKDQLTQTKARSYMVEQLKKIVKARKESPKPSLKTAQPLRCHSILQ